MNMMERKIRRWILFANMSIGTNIILAAGKLLIALYTASFFLCIHAFYNLGLALAKIVSLRYYAAGKESARTDVTDQETLCPEGTDCYYNVGGILVVTSLFYIIYSMRLFGYGTSPVYPRFTSIAIAAIAFAELGVAVYGIMIARKSRIPAFISLKMINLVSALVAIVLCQTTILSFTYDGDPSFYNGVLGVLFGFVFMMIGIYMVFCMGLYRPGFVKSKERS